MTGTAAAARAPGTTAAGTAILAVTGIAPDVVASVWPRTGVPGHPRAATPA
jgi:hypothetical protein